jgi:hypothetical protein
LPHNSVSAEWKMRVRVTWDDLPPSFFILGFGSFDAIRHFPGHFLEVGQPVQDVGNSAKVPQKAP